MYTTFVGLHHDQQNQQQQHNQSAGSRAQKAKRHQVSRACEPCRSSRAKCSDSRPCKTCIERGCQCTDSSGTSRASASVPTTAEVEELRSKIQKLEKRLHSRAGPSPPDSTTETRSTSPTRPTTRDNTRDDDSHGANTVETAEALLSLSSSKDVKGGAFAPIAFSRRLGFHVSPFSDNAAFDGDRAQEDAILFDERLSKSAQLYHIGNFWLYLHYILPILCERDTDAHFEMLWPSTPFTSSMAQMRRRSSPLTDIVIACAMQHDAKSRAHPASDHGNSDVQRWYFERSQSIVVGEAIDTPELMYVQTLILLSHYLANEGKLQKASGFSSMAMRVAMAIDLHRDPPTTLTSTQQELRRRIWWTMYTTEAIDAVTNGRPWTLEGPTLNVRIMAEDPETAVVACSKFAKDDGTGTTWLSFAVQMASLYQLAVTGLTGRRNDEGREDPIVAKLEQWARRVPGNLRTMGIVGNNGVNSCTSEEVNHSFDETPFTTSIDRYRLKIDIYKPQWLQKQRLLIELHFRHVLMLFCRHSIEEQLDRKDAGDEPSQTASKCLNHALSISRILLQVLTETALLDSQFEALHMLWNASLTLVAFSVAFGARSRGRNILETLRLNCEVFDHFACLTNAAGRARSQLQQFLHQMGVSTPVESAPPPTTTIQLPRTRQSSLGIMQPSPPVSARAAYNQEDGTHAVSEAGPPPLTNFDATAQWAAQFGHPLSLADTVVPSGSVAAAANVPPMLTPQPTWQGPPSVMSGQPESYRAFASEGADDVDMDNFMFDFGSISSAGQQSSGRI